MDYRKNLEGAIRGYAELPAPMRDAHQLVIACNLAPHLRFSLRIFARRLGIESRNLLLTGFVSDRDLAALYREPPAVPSFPLYMRAQASRSWRR